MPARPARARPTQRTQGPDIDKATPEFNARVQAALRTPRVAEPAPTPATLLDLETNSKWKWIELPGGPGPTQSSAVIAATETQATATKFFLVTTGGVVGISYRGPYPLPPKV